MENINNTRLIEGYYQGTLKGNDKALFKQLMKEDAAFKKEVKEFKKIFKGLEALHIENFQNTIGGFESQYQNKVVAINDNNIRPIRKYFAAAGVIALLICATFAYSIMGANPYDQHFQASQSIAVHMESIRGNEGLSQIEQTKKSAFTAYQMKKYDKCISLLTDYKDNNEELALKDYQSLLVLGVAQLATEQIEKAVENLAIVKDSKDSSFQQEAEWMWVLAQFKLEKGAETKSTVEKIANKEGHIYQAKAAKLLGDL